MTEKPCLLLILFYAQLLSYAFISSAVPSPYPDPTCGPRDDLTVVRREEYDNGRILDITHRYREDMPSWDSDGLGQFLWLPKSMKNGSLANNSEMKMPTHSGTHVDAPGHVFQDYFDAGFDVDTLDLAVLNGPALLVDVPRDTNLTAEAMELLSIPRGVRRVLFRTLNTDRLTATTYPTIPPLIRLRAEVEVPSPGVDLYATFSTWVHVSSSPAKTRSSIFTSHSLSTSSSSKQIGS